MPQRKRGMRQGKGMEPPMHTDGPSPAWPFTVNIERRTLASGAGAAAPVPSVRIGGSNFLLGREPLLAAGGVGHPHEQNPYTFESHAAGITCVVRVELPGAAKGPCASSALHGSAPRQNGRDDSP
ncbi:MAG TPA: hypothetical protein VK741_28185, partial [Acetobacteraceae bacterium]|nr:hypothetical protein [Acetobacteraceae bacterium]